MTAETISLRALAPQQIEAQIVARVRALCADPGHGQLVIQIHDQRVVQVEETTRTRFRATRDCD